LAPSVVLGNTLLDFAILVSELVITYGGFAFFESPVSRAAHSPFAMDGREDHAAMWDDPVLDEHLDLGQYEHIYFDQCCTRDHPCVQKTTQLSATRRLDAALRPRFVPLRCNLPAAQHAHVPGGPSSDGRFASEALSRYSAGMKQLIAESIIECIASGKSEPGGALPSRAALGRAPPANLANGQAARTVEFVRVTGAHAGRSRAADF
jgi:hypothetical protein